jgi:hypothetical protein
MDKEFRNSARKKHKVEVQPNAILDEHAWPHLRSVPSAGVRSEGVPKLRLSVPTAWPPQTRATLPKTTDNITTVRPVITTTLQNQLSALAHSTDGKTGPPGRLPASSPVRPATRVAAPPGPFTSSPTSSPVRPLPRTAALPGPLPS